MIARLLAALRAGPVIPVPRMALGQDPPAPVKGCRAPDGRCPRSRSCSRHNACEWESWAAVNPPRAGTV